jgi:hypothetical protein
MTRGKHTIILKKKKTKWWNKEVSPQIKISVIPLSGSACKEGTFMHGKQSTLLSSALKESRTIRATNAVTCRRKSKRTANAVNEIMKGIQGSAFEI